MDNTLAQTVLRLCEDTRSPVSDQVAMLVKSCRWADLVNMRVKPVNYSTPLAYLQDAAVVDLLRKCKGIDTGIDTAQVAVDNFWLAEKQCFSTNRRLYPLCDIPPSDWGPHYGVLGDILSLARKITIRTLGSFPCDVEGRFGPGSTYGDRGPLSTVADKMSSRPTITPDAMAWMIPWSATKWAEACLESGREPVVVKGNRFTTVPKDATKDRGICIEPSLNVFYQLGLGRHIRACLKRIGIDLRQGQEKHKQIACAASKLGTLATIDLSNASDTVCRALVRLLLPSEWHSMLDSLRSPSTEIGGKRVRLEKFSSMGNGFTFELETLIFYALSKATCEVQGRETRTGVDILTYGDDIIVPSECASGVLKVLSFCGFSANAEKTFFEGPFRESCGGDYFEGVDVRPFFQKEIPDAPEKLIRLANGLRRLRQAVHTAGGDSDYGLHAWFGVLDALPSWVRRCRGPQALGDIVIHDDERTWSLRVSDSIRFVKVYRPVTKRAISWDHWTPQVVLACALYGYGEGSIYHVGPKGRVLNRPGGVTPRDAVSGYRVGWTPFS